jgi:hypothetical protein
MRPTTTARPPFPVGLVLCVILPAIALALAVLYWSSAQQRATAKELLEQKAEQLAAEVDAELERTVSALRVLGMADSLQRGDLRAFHERAARAVAADPRWENVQLISTDGRQLVNVRLPYGSPLPPLNRPELPLQAVYKREPVVSDVSMAVVAKRMLTAVYVPVLQEGQARYVIAAAIEPPNWQSMLRSRLPPGVHAALLDRFSFVITTTYDSDPAAISSVAASMPPAAPGELSKDLARTQASGFEQVAMRKAGWSGWTVVTFMTRDAPTPRRQHFLLLATLALLVLACGLAIGLGFAHRPRASRS